MARTGLMQAARGVLLSGIVVCGAVGLWGVFRP